MTTYETKAYEIIKDSIKSAIFIDENARTFFQNEEELTGEDEEEISINLYNNFKESGISLSVHKYQIGDEKNSSIKEYLFEDRDLILLDWKLDGNDGQEYSLELLADIVKRPHIHFCTVYTSESNNGIDDVFKNILSYFSDNTLEYYDEIKEELELEPKISAIKDQLDNISLNRNTDGIGRLIGKVMQSNQAEVKEIKQITSENDTICAIIKASIALSDSVKAQESNPCPTIASYENKFLIIDNTIITILNKEKNIPEELIENISELIVKSTSSFTQLLGLEMQTIFSKSSSFLDSNLLGFSMGALMQHRANYADKDLQYLFPEFIKSMMLEQAKLNIRDKRISLLEDSFLESQNNSETPKELELISMNVFYNSSKLREHELNFGDVFKKKNCAEYYICITALCDCLNPSKICNAFFFAKGTPIKKSDALELGDTAFISYLSDTQIVKWTDVITKIKDDFHKYSPVYIKPLQFTIVKSTINPNKYTKFKSLGLNGKIETFKAKYITTIKENYAQRIANHAFAHPLRVGVDFVESVKKETL